MEYTFEMRYGKLHLTTKNNVIKQMKLIQRIGYYLGGFSVGLVILAFFFNGKKTSCAYGPEARVLKNINSKPIAYTPALLNATDTTNIKKLLKSGEVLFSKSDTRKAPCGIYVIEGSIAQKEAELSLENCDSLVTIKSFQFK